MVMSLLTTGCNTRITKPRLQISNGTIINNPLAYNTNHGGDQKYAYFFTKNKNSTRDLKKSGLKPVTY